MKVFRIFKKKPRHLGHGEVIEGPMPTTSDASTAGDVPTASDAPAASGTSSPPIGAEILVQGVDPITAE